MTPQEIARQRAEVMMAFADGAEIEYKPFGAWIDLPNHQPDWNCFCNDYRVKTQPKTVTIETWLYPDGQVKQIEEGKGGHLLVGTGAKRITTTTIPLD